MFLTNVSDDNRDVSKFYTARKKLRAEQAEAAGLRPRRPAGALKSGSGSGPGRGDQRGLRSEGPRSEAHLPHVYTAARPGHGPISKVAFTYEKNFLKIKK